MFNVECRRSAADMALSRFRAFQRLETLDSRSAANPWFPLVGSTVFPQGPRVGPIAVPFRAAKAWTRPGACDRSHLTTSPFFQSQPCRSSPAAPFDVSAAISAMSCGLPATCFIKTSPSLETTRILVSLHENASLPLHAFSNSGESRMKSRVSVSSPSTLDIVKFHVKTIQRASAVGNFPSAHKPPDRRIVYAGSA